MSSCCAHHRPLSLAAALTALLALAGCGTASSTTSATGAPGGTGTASATATTSTTTAATSSHPPSAAASRCRGAGLQLIFLGEEGATGHGELGFALRNTLSHACHTGGYPAVAFLDAAGRRLPTPATHATGDFFGATPLRPLTVAPGRSVSFRLDVSHGSGRRGTCQTARGLVASAPGDTHVLQVAMARGAYECGPTVVSPLQPGRSAFQHG